MSEVIRDAVVRLRIELKKARLESPEIEHISRAYSEQSRSAREATRAIVETQRATTEAARTHEEFGQKSFKAFAHAGHGAMTLARGIALMAASGEEDSRKLLESLVKVEAAVSIAKGAASMGKLAAEFGPVGIAVAAVTTVVAVGVAVWHKYASAQEEVRRATEATRREMDKQADSVRTTMALTSEQQREKFGIREKNAITRDQLEKAQRESREELKRQIKTNQAYYQKDAPQFATDFDYGRRSLIHDPKGMESQGKTALGYEKERQKLLGLQLDQERELYQQQRTRLQVETEANRSGFGAATMMAGAFAGGGLPFAALGQQAADQNKAAMDKMVKVQTDGLEAITGAYDTAVKHIRDLENELRFASPK